MVLAIRSAPEYLSWQVSPTLTTAAKWPATFDQMTANPELDREIEYAAFLASRVMSSLVAKRDGLFPQKREPWYQPTDEDVPK